MIRLLCKWEFGYAFDFHTTRSVYNGQDEYGHDIYITERTPIGELLYQLKYKSTWNRTRELVRNMVDMLCADEGFQEMMSHIEMIVTVPPSNKSRILQPVTLVAEELAARFRKGLETSLLQNTNTEQIKNLDTQDKYDLVAASASVQYHLLNPAIRYLILDDIYDSGSTLRAYVDRLQAYGCSHVSVFTLTRTKSAR